MLSSSRMRLGGTGHLCVEAKAPGGAPNSRRGRLQGEAEGLCQSPSLQLHGSVRAEGGAGWEGGSQGLGAGSQPVQWGAGTASVPL